VSDEQSLTNNSSLQTADDLLVPNINVAEAMEVKQDEVKQGVAEQNTSDNPFEADSSFSVVDEYSGDSPLKNSTEERKASKVIAESVTEVAERAKINPLKGPAQEKVKAVVNEKDSLPLEPSVSPAQLISLEKPVIVSSIPVAVNRQVPDGELAIMSWPADSYTLQVMAAGQLASINEFVASQPNRDLLRVITLRRNGAPWYVVFGGVYESREEARLAILSLPKSQKNTQPWPRKILEIQQKISDFRRK